MVQACVVWRSVLQPPSLLPPKGLGAVGQSAEHFTKPALGGAASQHKPGNIKQAYTRAGRPEWQPHHTFLPLFALLQTQVSPGQFLQLVIDVVIEGLFLLGSD